VTRHGGFTIVELVIALAIMMAVMASIFRLMDPAQGMFAAQPEAVEMQQRLRVGLDVLIKDLMMAGAGIYSGSIGGPLNRAFAPILPYRIGTMGADSPGTYFTDRISVVYVPPTFAQTRIADPVGSILSTISVTSERGCPTADPACGFEKGMGALIMDDTGAWDTFTVSDVQGSVLQLQHRGSQLNKMYKAGSPISQIVTCTYWLKIDATTDTYQLMRYDGNQSDLPVSDNVVNLSFEYFGDAVPRVANADLIKLSAAELTDGPWRPDAGAAGRYDADLLRVRRIAIKLRVQAAARFRGPTGPLFMRGGTSSRSEHSVPDHEIRFDISPRNVNLPR
jgi:hypothetical protein